MMLCNAWWRVLKRALAVLAGCTALTGLSCCGKPAPPPVLHLAQSSITPDKTISPGQVLQARARFSEPVTSSRISVVLLWDFGTTSRRQMRMYDDGTHGDPAAGDGEYSLDLRWKGSYVRGDAVRLSVAASDQYFGILSGSSPWTTLSVSHLPAGRASGNNSGGQR